MSHTLVLPSGFQYILPALLSTVFVLLGQNRLVNSYRKRANISYPQVYAEKAEVEASKDALLFNCAQRAHQNTLENIPLVYMLTIMGGLSFPIFSAIACTFWSIDRISFTRGYITGDPQNRITFLHRLGAFFSLGLVGAALYTAGTVLEVSKAKEFSRQILSSRFNVAV